MVTDTQTHTHTHTHTHTQNDYCDPPAHAPRVKKLSCYVHIAVKCILEQALLLSAYGLANRLNDQWSITMQRLEASSQLESQDFEKHALCSLIPHPFGHHAFEIAWAHIHFVGTTYHILALLIKVILPVKCMFLSLLPKVISAYA